MHTHEHHLPDAATSPLHRLPAGIKVLGAVILVLCASLLPRSLALWLLVPAAFLVVLTLVSGVARFPLLKRIVVFEPFVLGVALLALFSPAESWAARWMFFLFLLARCTLALAAMVLFTAITPFGDVMRVFRQARVPALLVTTLALMHRYVAVLADESGRMRRARESRTFTRRRRFAWRTLSTVIGQLFLRASERADRIYDAMCSRGWRP